MQTIKPAPDQIFCKQIEGDTVTKSGILLPSSAVEKTDLAHVINVGSRVEEYKSKQTIVYKPYATVTIKMDKVEYLLIHQDDVLGVVVESDEDV